MRLVHLGVMLAVAACARGVDRTATTRAPQATEVGAPHSAGEKACAVRADYTVMQSAAPPAWLASEERQGPCDMDQEGRLLEDDDADFDVEVGNSGDGSFTVTSRGPQGSGRYWDIGVSFRDSGGMLKGFCFTTSTVGWRHVGGDQSLAKRLHGLLGRVQDLDDDGRQELVIPSSFPLSDEAPLSEHGMTASAYGRVGDAFVLDEDGTRLLRSKIADAYREAAGSPSLSQEVRDHFTEAADQLSKAACTP